jgi:hypothetical protein
MRKCLAGAALVALVALAVSAGAATGPSTIRITDVELKMQPVNAGGPAEGAGDMEIVRMRLYNPSIRSKPIGRGDLICTYVDSKARQCNGTYSLPRGKLVVSGLLSTRLLYELAVVGGTGIYDDARGSLTATTTQFSPRHEVLVFRLAG